MTATTTPPKPAVEVLCRDYMPLALKLARRQARGRPWLRAELESEAMYQLWRIAKAWDPELMRNFATAVYSWLPHRLAERVRRELRHAAPGRVLRDSQGDMMEMAAFIPDPRPDGTGAVDAMLDVPEMLAPLDPADRAALVGVLMDGRSGKAVGGELGVSGGVARKRAAVAADAIAERWG